jgi:hypothetical protein
MEVLDEELGGSKRSVKGSSPPLVRVLFFPLPIFAAFLLFEITCNNRNGSALSTCTVCSRDLKVAALLFVRSALGKKKFFF